MRQGPGTRAVTCHVSRYKTECGQAHSRVCQTSYTTACQHSVTLDCRTEHSEVGHVSNILHYTAGDEGSVGVLSSESISAHFQGLLTSVQLAATK